MKRVIVELQAAEVRAVEAFTAAEAEGLPGFELDAEYQPVPMGAVAAPEGAMATAAGTILIRGMVDEEKEEQLRSSANVVGVWTDAVIEPFGASGDGSGEEQQPSGVDEREALSELQMLIDTGGATWDSTEGLGFDIMAAPPCPPVDCQSWVAKGTITDVARYLRCDRLWSKGIRGQGIVIGICDTGVDSTVIPQVIGGWSPNPASPPGSIVHWHGTMCATDALGMAPNAKIYDIGILKSTAVSSGGFLSDAIAAFQWAINQYKTNKTPQILSNSWGLFKKDEAPDYATDANHPFSRKVVETIDTGILVTFAAGNCGQVCPSQKCGSSGPGNSIWGANGHPRVMTVGAANIKEEWIGYSSQGPAALDPKKPNFVAPSHFKGYRPSDTGTSAACPVCAGVLALFRSHDATLDQDRAKDALEQTAKNLCGPEWDQHSGYGMIQAEAAFNKLFFFETPLIHASWVHGNSVEEEYPERLLLARPMGPYGMFYGKRASFNWFHYAIPTPVIVNARRLRLDSVMLVFLTSPDTWVTNVHIWDGNSRIQAYDGLMMTGAHWFERFDILNRYVRLGIGVSVGVKFGGENRDHHVAFVSAGGDFIK